MRNRHPELLIPASSLEVLKTAVMFGADAVYIGGEAFGLRAKAKILVKALVKKAALPTGNFKRLPHAAVHLCHHQTSHGCRYSVSH